MFANRREKLYKSIEKTKRYSVRVDTRRSEEGKMGKRRISRKLPEMWFDWAFISLL